MFKIFALLFCMLSSSIIWATNPCSTIYKACRDAKFYLGGGDVGKGIVRNCMIPLVNQEKVLPNTYFDKLTLSMCQVWLHDKFNNKTKV